MSEELAKLCRICFQEGSREIFAKNRSAESDTISSLNRIVEKYRFVSMLAVSENDGLPQMICDSCIIQLNVAYNFKMKAIESDTKLRQYVIEKGLNTSTSEVPAISNFITTRTHTICDFVTPALASTEYMRNFETPQSIVSTTLQPEPIPQPYRCMPMQIKVEYVDEETPPEPPIQAFSDSSSVRSHEHLHGGMVRVDEAAGSKDDISDQEFVRGYLQNSRKSLAVPEKVEKKKYQRRPKPSLVSDRRLRTRSSEVSEAKRKEEEKAKTRNQKLELSRKESPGKRGSVTSKYLARRSRK